VRDGLLELPETFTLTLTQIVERGGGTIRFVDPNAAGQLPAVATITDTADQERRREGAGGDFGFGAGSFAGKRGRAARGC